jgi:hypothetical protein
LPDFETDSFSKRNGNFCAGAGNASDVGLGRAHVEHANASQLNAIVLANDFFILSRTVLTASSGLVLVIPTSLTTL